MREDDFYALPTNLPVPVDDGGCDHLTGIRVPAMALVSTSGRRVDLAQIARDRAVIYCYPWTGAPGRPVPNGWDQIPGARGCTPESCGFRDHYQELRRLNAEIFGLSTQSPDYQREMASRLQLPFEILSDEDFALTNTLQLPTFEFEGARLLKRLSLVLSKGRIEKVFYPVFPPDKHAEEVMEWLSQHRVGTG